jgi:hypothetical protein
MTQAAFAVMKGQAVPNDPVYGLALGWDPHHPHPLPPDSPAFAEMQLKPIIVPK